jgi:hypothetical protein
MKHPKASTPLCYCPGIDGKPMGHIWETTTSPSAQRCTRCHLVQYKSKTGHWKNARSLKDARASQKRAIQLATLWEELENDA